MYTFFEVTNIFKSDSVSKYQNNITATNMLLH